MRITSMEQAKNYVSYLRLVKIPYKAVILSHKKCAFNHNSLLNFQIYLRNIYIYDFIKHILNLEEGRPKYLIIDFVKKSDVFNQ